MINCNNHWKKTWCAITVCGTLFLAVPAPVEAQIDAIGPWVTSKNMERLRKRSKAKAGNSSKTRRQRTVKQTAKSKSIQPEPRERYPQVKVNGKQLSNAGAAVEINGNTFVGFREIFEALGATVTYNDQKRVITARTPTKMMQFTLPGGDADSMTGQRVSYASGTKPFMRRGVLMVPLRLVVEKMGAQVTYTQNSGTPLVSIIGKPV